MPKWQPLGNKVNEDARISSTLNGLHPSPMIFVSHPSIVFIATLQQLIFLETSKHNHELIS